MKMSNRFPVSDEQIFKPKTLNIMKEALKIIEETQEALKNYKGDKIKLKFIVPRKDLTNFANQENLNLHRPSCNVLNYYWCRWNIENIEVSFETEPLKIKSIIFEDEE